MLHGDDLWQAGEFSSRVSRCLCSPHFLKCFPVQAVIPFASTDFLVCPLHFADLTFGRYLLSPIRSGFFHVPRMEAIIL